MTMKPNTLDGWKWQEIRDCQLRNKRKNKAKLRRRYRRQLERELLQFLKEVV